jgi:hypothetical protein
MDLKPKISEMRKVFRENHMTAQIAIAALGIVGALVGFAIKKYWMRSDQEAAAVVRQGQEQKTNDAQVQAAADETGRDNARKTKQDAAAEAFAKGGDSPTK